MYPPSAHSTMPPTPASSYASSATILPPHSSPQFGRVKYPAYVEFERGRPLSRSSFRSSRSGSGVLVSPTASPPVLGEPAPPTRAQDFQAGVSYHSLVPPHEPETLVSQVPELDTPPRSPALDISTHVALPPGQLPHLTPPPIEAELTKPAVVSPPGIEHPLTPIGRISSPPRSRPCSRSYSRSRSPARITPYALGYREPQIYSSRTLSRRSASSSRSRRTSRSRSPIYEPVAYQGPQFPTYLPPPSRAPIIIRSDSSSRSRSRRRSRSPPSRNASIVGLRSPARRHCSRSPVGRRYRSRSPRPYPSAPAPPVIVPMNGNHGVSVRSPPDLQSYRPLPTQIPVPAQVPYYRSRSRSRSHSPPPIIVQAESRSRSPSRTHERRRRAISRSSSRSSRSRTPPPVIISQGNTQPPIVIDSGRRSPTRILADAFPGYSGRIPRSRSPRRRTHERSTRRGYSPVQVIVQQPTSARVRRKHARRRSRDVSHTPQPQTTRNAPPPQTIVIQPPAFPGLTNTPYCPPAVPAPSPPLIPQPTAPYSPRLGTPVFPPGWGHTPGPNTGYSALAANWGSAPVPQWAAASGPSTTFNPPPNGGQWGNAKADSVPGPAPCGRWGMGNPCGTAPGWQSWKQGSYGANHHAPTSYASHPPPVPSSGSPKHPRFWYQDGTVIVVVANTEYRLHQYLLGNTSWNYSGINHLYFDKQDFDRFLSVLYPSDRSEHECKTAEEWASVLCVANANGMQDIRRLALKQLSSCAGPVEKIMLGHRYNITEWLEPAYLELTMRSAPITPAEGRKLGVQALVRLGALKDELYSNVAAYVDYDKLSKLFASQLEIGKDPLEDDDSDSDLW